MSRKKISKIFVIIFDFMLFCLFSLYVKIFKISHKNIWLISERGHEARDNAFVFYNYLKTNHKEKVVKFIVDKKSNDYFKIEESDRIDYHSIRHWIYFLTSGTLVSTHQMGCSPNSTLFNRLVKKINIGGIKILLKHGITKDKIDYDVNNIDLIVAVTNDEYLFLKENYDFKNLKLIGFARYDNLISNVKKQILLMPTFRKSLNFVDDFSKTNYFKTYNKLLNSKKLIEILELNELELVFYPHYEVQKHIHLFKSSSNRVNICSLNKYDVQELLIKSEILITDYSSVFFDFAYMEKPVIYYQFDYDDYRKTQYEQGYFNYERDGFGPIVEKEDEIFQYLNKIINYGMCSKYKKRVSQTFKYRDKKNCERLYNEIVKILKEGI